MKRAVTVLVFLALPPISLAAAPFSMKLDEANVGADKIHCYLDGELHMEVTDDTFGAAGKVGLWTKADAQTRFVGFRAIDANNRDDQLPQAPAGKTWKLVWDDEFDGDKLDESKWGYRPDGKRKGAE